MSQRSSAAPTARPSSSTRVLTPRSGSHRTGCAARHRCLIEEPGRDLYESIDELAARVKAHSGDLDTLADSLLATQPERARADDASILLIRVTETGALGVREESLSEAGDLQDSGDRR
jgi:hypothetical protein